jgi:2'-5' RNA ligase
MRLFVAVEIDSVVRAVAAELIDGLRERALRLAPRSRITWVAPDRLHVTVRFIGHVEPEDAERVRQLLASPLEQDPFRLTIAGVGTFPPKRPPRVVWAGVTEGRISLAATEREVSGRLASAGIAPEEGPYSPHLTLARVRETGGLRSTALLQAVNDQVLGTSAVEAITLFESRLSPKGPTYVALQRTGLRAVRL